MSDKKDKTRSIQKDRGRKKSKTMSDKKDALLHSALQDSLATSDVTVNLGRDATLAPVLPTGSVVIPIDILEPINPIDIGVPFMGPEPDKWYFSGWLGIGTTTPNAPLEVMPTVNGLSTGLQFYGHHTPGHTAGGVINSCDANGTVRPLTLQINGGNVGIGTTNPTYPLHVKADWGFLALDSKVSGQDSGLRLMEGGAVKWHIWNSANDSKFNIVRDGLPASLTIDQNGNVGIGTRNPTHPLHVKTDWGFLALDSNMAGQDSGLRLMEGGAVKWHFFNSARDTKLYLVRDGLSASLTIDQSGNVDIGANPIRFSSGWTGSPDAVTNRAEISNDTGGFKTLMIVGNNSAGLGRRVSVWDRLEVNGELIVTGNQTIGASISYGGQLNKLDVAEGDTFAYIRAHDLWFGHSSRRGGVGRALVDLPKKFDDEILNTLRINFEADWGAVVIGGRVETPSSRRLKENIQILSSQVARKIITTLEPVTFTYKQDDLKLECLGFIAEDAPSEVTLPTKDTVTFNHIVAALTRVVKDQEQSIRELRAQVNLLKK